MPVRILVCSDSHGRADLLGLAYDQQPTAEALVFLGDGVDDAYLFTRCGKRAVLVRGNCDGNAKYPLSETFEAGGKTILCTHGHSFHVKYGPEDLRITAQALGASLALYGHTHQAKLDYEDGIYLFNPGCLHDGEYGFVDITPAGIVCVNARVRRYY